MTANHKPKSQSVLIKKGGVMKLTNEGGVQYEHSLDHHLEFFSKAGSLFTKRKSFYGQEESALSLFQKMWIVERVSAMKLLFWLRDCRGGAGNRSGFRACIEWLAKFDPKWLSNNIHLIPLHGRWDDLRTLFNSSIEEEVASFWKEALSKKDVLAAKWADRSDFPLRKLFGMNIGDFRRFLAKLRKNHIVEHKMCTNRWNEIEYKTVPSVAMSRYTKAFMRHDEDRFTLFKEKVKKGEVEIKASVLFPHDCVRTVIYGDPETGELQFEALPNYLEGVNEKIIVISDTSGSMDTVVSGSVRAVDISQGMALYCSAKMPEDSPFYKKFIGFCSEGNFKDWNGMSFSKAVRSRKIFDGAVGSTRIDLALDLILKTATFFKLPQEYMPTTLLIVSDMQFHQGTRGNDTEVNKSLKSWEVAGYKIPKIVYWNTAGYTGSSETVKARNTGLVSGFSPSILKAIFSGDDFTPLAIMNRAIEKYKIYTLEGIEV